MSSVFHNYLYLITVVCFCYGAKYSRCNKPSLFLCTMQLIFANMYYVYFYIHFTVVELFIQQRETKDTHTPLVNQHFSNCIEEKEMRLFLSSCFNLKEQFTVK